MTKAVIEPAVFSCKPKKLSDQMGDVARESPAFFRRLRDYGVAGSE